MNKSKCNIKKATKKDLNFIFNNVLSFYRENPNEIMLISKSRLKKAVGNLFKNRDNSYYLIMFDNKRVGFIQTMQTNKDILEIILIYLKPQYRRKGLGTQALNRITQNSRHAVIKTEVNNTNRPSQKFFTKLNFKKHSIIYNLKNNLLAQPLRKVNRFLVPYIKSFLSS